MVQRFWATLLILAGLGGIGYGVATATVLRESDTVVATATPSGDGTMVVTDPGVLGLVDDQVTVRATVPEGQTVTLALGSDVDVLGWVGEDPYDAVTGLSTWETLSVAPGTGLATGDEEAEDTEEPAEAPTTGPNPAGSDMWISEVSGETVAQMRWTEEPGRVVLLAAGVGENAVAPTLELTWPRPVATPYLWPGVLGGGFALILGIFMAIGARRGKKTGAGKGRSSAVRSRRPESDQPHRDAVFGVDGEQSEPLGNEPDGGYPPASDDPVEGGTSVYPPSRSGMPGRRPPVQGAPPVPDRESAPAWGPPAPFGGAAPITPPPAPEPVPAADPVAAPAASARGLRRSRRNQGPGAGPAQPPVAPAQPPAGRTPFAPAPGQAPARPAPGEGAPAAQAAPAAAAPSGKPMTRREMRMREQAQRRAATGAMPTVPPSEAEPEPAPDAEQPQTPSSRAAAWRQTWGVTGDGDDR
ncbi:hypothetical protein AB1046_12010 [Promicromonospora sp. Populi]|uniref:hypothetical protein n=1 Tax=Promicromonospora sp. Populi TaxID=3239420 RepID=UPI0034E1F84F